MANENAYRDENQVTVLLAVDDTTGDVVRIPTNENGDLLIAATIADATVPDGGTGRTSFTEYAPIFGGTTSTGALQSGTVGSAGEVLTSNGAGALPTFQPAAAAGGTVTSVSVTTANGVSGVVADATTTPAITLTLGAITPTTVNGATIAADSITFGGTEVLTLAATKNVTFADAFATSGANSLTLTTTGATNVTLPTSGTLVNSAVTTLSSLVSVGTITTGVWNGTDIAVADGGTGASTLTANNVILGNGTSPVQFVAPGTSGNVLTSNGTTWTSATPASGGTARRNLNIIFSSAHISSYGAAATDTANLNGMTFAPAASSAAMSGLSVNANSTATLDFYDQDPEINITARCYAGTSTGDGRYYFGDFGDAPSDGDSPVHTTTTKSMFVVCVVASGTPTWYAVNADGTTNTNASMTGISDAIANQWRIVKTSTTNIKYYCNYVLKATNTTNLPSGDNASTGAIFNCGCGNNTGDSTSRAANFGFLDILLNSPTG